MPPIDVIELGKDGTYTTMPDPGTSTTSAAPAPASPDGLPAVPGESAPPPVPHAGEERLAAAPEPVEADDDEPLRDDSEINAERLNRRFARLTAARRKAERERDTLAQQHQVELAQLRGHQEALQRIMQGAAPELPQTPPQPTGPPQAAQFELHEEFVQAAANYATDQRFQQERQREQQMQFQRDLMTREEQFTQAHPDFDSVVRTGLAGKVSPVLQQALMLVPDGPAVAYTLATQPELVRRLNTLPPPLVLVELGRLSPPATPPVSPAVGGANGTTQPPAVSATPLPEPMTPVGGGGSMVQPQYNENASQKEYEQWRARTSQLPYLRRS